MKTNNLTPVETAGEFFCEHEDCRVVQNNDEESVLFYGDDNGMYCKEHVLHHLEVDISPEDYEPRFPRTEEEEKFYQDALIKKL